MKSFKRNIQFSVMGLLMASMFLISCNKNLPVAKPIDTPLSPGLSIMEMFYGANYSFLRAAIYRAGMASTLLDRSAVFTVFAPTDAAFIASGIPSVDVINSLPVATLRSILSYHILGGQKYGASAILEKYPNMYMQSLLVLAGPSATNPPGYRMPLCISRRGSSAWANNIPVTQADIQANNGVIHNIAALLSPPSLVIAQTVGGDPSYSYLLKAIQRGDAGPPPGAPALMPILSNAAANLTLFAPTDAAFNTLLAGLGLPQSPSSIDLLPTTTVWGIVAFHLQTVRAFGPNIDNTSRASLMGVAQQFNTTGGLKVRGPGNVVPTPGGPVNYFANVTSANINQINGVIHRVDAVLIPQ